MGRKKKEKKKEKLRAVENTSAVSENTVGSTVEPEQPDFSHLSGEWREFYRLVTDRLSLRQ